MGPNAGRRCCSRPEERRKFQNEGNLYESQVQFSSELFVPVEWVLKSPTAIFSQPVFLPNI